MLNAIILYNKLIKIERELREYGIFLLNLYDLSKTQLEIDVINQLINFSV